VLSLDFFRPLLFKKALALFLKMFFDVSLLNEKWKFKSRVVVTLLELPPATARAGIVSPNLHSVSWMIKITWIFYLF
jgi:hypothetical protein